jgi:hypothetical protein
VTGRMSKHSSTNVGRRAFLKSSIALGALSTMPAPSAAVQAAVGANDREYWVQVMTRIAQPVLEGSQ